jgi:enoyl-CoA hydratase
MLTARIVPADEAHAIGLLDRLVEPGEAEKAGRELAATLIKQSPAALTAVLRCVDDAFDQPLAEGLKLEAERINALFEGPQAREGIAAFLQKRPPSYG